MCVCVCVCIHIYTYTHTHILLYANFMVITNQKICNRYIHIKGKEIQT